MSLIKSSSLNTFLSLSSALCNYMVLAYDIFFSILSIFPYLTQYLNRLTRLKNHNSKSFKPKWLINSFKKVLIMFLGPILVIKITSGSYIYYNSYQNPLPINLGNNKLANRLLGVSTKSSNFLTSIFCILIFIPIFALAPIFISPSTNDGLFK